MIPRPPRCGNFDRRKGAGKLEPLEYIASATIALFAIANFVLALAVYRLHKSLTMPKVVIFSDLIERDDREVYGLFVQNVGQNPALNVDLTVRIEEWKDGRRVDSKWHDTWDSYGADFIVLQPQEKQVFELPSLETSYIVTAKVTSSNCPSDSARFCVGTDPGAVREVFGGRRKLKAFGKNLKFILDAKVMKDFGKEDEDELPDEGESVLTEKSKSSNVE